MRRKGHNYTEFRIFHLIIEIHIIFTIFKKKKISTSVAYATLLHVAFPTVLLVIRRLCDAFTCCFSDGFARNPSLMRRFHLSLFQRFCWISVAYAMLSHVAFPTFVLDIRRLTFTTVENMPSLNRRFKFNRRLLRCCLSDGYSGVGNPTTIFRCLTKNQSVVHATGKCQKSDMMAVGFLVKM